MTALHDVKGKTLAMVVPWLDALAWAALLGGGISAVSLAIELRRRPAKMAVMNVVWPVTALYLGPLAVWLFRRYGRAAPDAKPFWAVTAVGVTHCGAGCTLGDIVAECGLFFTGTMLAGSRLDTSLVGDFMLAYVLGIAFQYFAIAPMRGVRGLRGIWAAMKADTLSLTAFELGLFAWMWGMHVLFRPELKPDQAVYWFSMQVGMALGFVTAFPMNWWLIRRGLKEAM